MEFALAEEMIGPPDLLAVRDRIAGMKEEVRDVGVRCRSTSSPVLTAAPPTLGALDCERSALADTLSLEVCGEARSSPKSASSSSADESESVKFASWKAFTVIAFEPTTFVGAGT